MRVYIWSRPTPPESAEPGSSTDRAAAPVVIELASWVRLFMVVACTLVALPLAGLIGFRHGFAETVGVPDLQRELGASFSDGVRLVLAAPLRVFDAGMNDTVALMLAMGVLITGAGALTLAVFSPSRAAPREGGGEEPPAGAALHAGGLVVCAIVSVVQIAWAIARSSDVVGEFMPWSPEAFAPWQAMVRITAGVDLIALAAAVVWLLVAARLRSMLWLRSLTLVVSASAVLALFAAGAMSNAIASQISQPRSLFQRGPVENGAKPDLILGHTLTHLVVIRDGGELQLISPDIAIAVVGRASISDFIGEPADSSEP